MTGKRVFEQPDDPQLAALVCLSRALDDLSLPIRIAKDWICPADLPEFLENIEKYIRALAVFIEDYLEKHSVALVEDQEDNKETARILEVELASARKNLVFLQRIGKTDTDKSTASDVVPGSADAETDTGKPTTAVVLPGSAPDFAAEAEELRKLRAGELKTDRPPDSKRPPS